MILISVEHSIENETQTLHQLFDAGLDHFHIRKPSYSLMETCAFLKRIDPVFHPYCVVYHTELLDSFNIKGIHQKSTTRNTTKLNESNTVSTSTHSISEFNGLPDDYHYAFLSPLFSSISKSGYTPKITLDTLEERTNHTTRLVGLGGITLHHLPEILQKVDDIALLGHIWLQNNPVTQWKKCQQIVQSFSV